MASPLLKYISIVPTTGTFPAMSRRNQLKKLEGIDPTIALQATSLVLNMIETGDTRTLISLFSSSDGAAIVKWLRTPHEASHNPGIIAPLALLSATTDALALSAPGVVDDHARNDASRRLMSVALRRNVDVTGEPETDTELISSMARSALWRAVENEHWPVWSADLIEELQAVSTAQPTLARFRDITGLSLEEWYYRGAAEIASRTIHGARSTLTTERVDPTLEAAWQTLSSTTVESAVGLAKASFVSEERPNPFDLSWLASRPFVTSPDGRRFAVWQGALQRLQLPAALAQALADSTGHDYKACAAFLGEAAENVLWRDLATLQTRPTEESIFEDQMPAGMSKCDVLFRARGFVAGVDFTMISPSRSLSEGAVDAVDDLVERLVAKFKQVYVSLDWADPGHDRRWLPVVVLASPSVSEPLLNEKVHARLRSKLPLLVSSDSELMTCHAPEFMDLIQLARSTGRPTGELIAAWRDSRYSGTWLDAWLFDQKALGGSTAQRAGRVGCEAERVLTRST